MDVFIFMDLREGTHTLFHSLHLVRSLAKSHIDGGGVGGSRCEMSVAAVVKGVVKCSRQAILDFFLARALHSTDGQSMYYVKYF